MHSTCIYHSHFYLYFDETTKNDLDSLLSILFENIKVSYYILMSLNGSSLSGKKKRKKKLLYSFLMCLVLTVREEGRTGPYGSINSCYRRNQ